MSKEKATLFVYKDGRIQLPKLVRDKLRVKSGDLMTIRVEKGEVILTPLKKKCAICENEDGLNCIDGQYICIDCIEKVVDVWMKWRYKDNG